MPNARRYTITLIDAESREVVRALTFNLEAIWADIA